MATYLKEEEIKVTLEKLIEKYTEECQKTGRLHPDLIELIKHDFFAKYVHFDSTTEMVEIGINESKERTPGYPEIKVYHYSLSETRQWLGERFKNSTFDLEFYAKIISRDQASDSDVVLLDKDD